MKNTMKMTLATALVAMTAMTMTTSANAGVYTNVFAGHYQHADGTPLNTAEVAQLSTDMADAQYSYGYTAAVVAIPLHAEIGTIATSLAQNSPVHWDVLKQGAQLNAQGGWMLTAVALDYGIRSQLADEVARSKGYKLTNFTDDVINMAHNFGTK